jgi:hypothetical protein
VVTDRHVLVVGQQRVVRAEQFADVLRVFDADVEVGVVADFAGRCIWQSAARAAVLRLGFDGAAMAAALAEQFQQARTQGDAGFATEFEEGIQRPPCMASTALRGAVEQTGSKRGLQVENVLADRHAARGAEPLMLNTPSGRFCNGKSRDRWPKRPSCG